MKVGMRIPSFTKSIKSRTTGRIKRATKSSYDPTYGIDGVGYLKDPERAIKNKVYHKVTADPLEEMKSKTPKAHSHSKVSIVPMILFYVIAIISFSYAEFIYLYLKQISFIGLIITIIGFALFALFYRSRYS